MRQFYTRKQGETKKQLYRRMAQTKKTQWASTHKLQSQTQFKTHFLRQEEEIFTDDYKTKKIEKEDKTEQRLRNRMAAQQSRERHRFYVEELERKAGLYDQLIAKQEHNLCQKCRQPIQSQDSDSEALLSSDCPVSANLHKPKQQIILHEYMNDQIIRIDNEGATSPFGIFFIICMIAFIAVFSFKGDTGDISTRLLANYQSTISNLIDLQASNNMQQTKTSSLPAFLQMVKAKNRQQTTSCPHEDVDTNTYKSSQNLRRSVAPPREDKWQKFGDYLCSEPKEEFPLSRTKFKENPEFFLVRAKRDKKSILQPQTPSSLDQTHTEPQTSTIKQWQQILISSCFLESS